jgi:hypothetical protein
MATLGSNFISGITTTIFESTDVVNKQYVDDYVGVIPPQTGNAGKFLTTINGTNSSWGYVSNYEEFTSTGAQTFTVPSYANLFLIEAVGAGGGGSAGTIGANSGLGGGSASYTSWYIPKAIVSSNMSVIPGTGGSGGNSSGASGSAGAGTTITWTGPGGTYTLTASGGGAGGVAGIAQLGTQSNYYYTTDGLAGASVSVGAGNNGSAQVNQFQPSSGGSGGYISNAGGAGGTIIFYGNETFASGGNDSGTSGSNATVISGLPYGFGGGGGGAGVSIAGQGGNGIRGGGGGGGGATASNFGNGGNGGDGYVKITWW